MAMQNLGSRTGLGFPISNYSMSLALLERVDFWDTSADAIGEDFHMFVKAYFKTHGQARRPLPFLCLSLAFLLPNSAFSFLPYHDLLHAALQH
jgi:hypothetical protein